MDSSEWGIPLYVRILDYLRDLLSLPQSEQTLHYGSSAGGHQALMTACLDRGSYAFANNPQTDITAYWPGLQKPTFKQVFDDDPHGTASVAEWPWRFRCVDLFRKEKHVPNLHIATNINSAQDFENQFLPFIEELPRVKASKSNVILEPYWDPKGGHSALDRGPTVKLINGILNQLQQ